MTSHRDEINGLIELVFNLNNTVLIQRDEIERLNKEVSMINTASKSEYEEIDSLNKTMRVMTNTIDWMMTSIPNISIIITSISMIFNMVLCNV